MSRGIWDTSGHLDNGWPRIQLYKDKAKKWRWRVVAINGKTIACSGEGYWNKLNCVSVIDILFGKHPKFYHMGLYEWNDKRKVWK